MCLTSTQLASLLLLQVVASGFPLKPQWSAVISGYNGDSQIQGTFRWDNGQDGVPEWNSTSFPKVEAHWNFTTSFFTSQSLEDSMGFACSFRDKQACTSTFRKSCQRGLIRTRTEALLRLLVRLQEKGTHEGDCSKYSAYFNATDSQLWSAVEEGVGNLSMCITSDGSPLAFASYPDKNFVGLSNVGVATFQFFFHNVSLGPQHIEEAACPDCVAAVPCEGGVVSMQLLRTTNGNGEPWDQIWNLDIADVPGEMMFDSGFSHRYLKIFNVTVNSSWGPGRDCNFLNGVNHISPAREPSMAKLVARRDAEGFMSCGGQCGKNSLGSYYAFPKEGGCPTGAPMGTDGCTWQVDSVKVVTTNCVKDYGAYAAAFLKDKGHHAPWTDMQAAITKGIALCPDIRQSLRR